MTATREQVVRAARRWCGTRWSHQHRLRDIGTDCAGLVIGVAADLNLAHPDVPAYSSEPDGSLLGYCDTYMQRVREPALGRVAVMKFGTEPQHLGFFGDYYLGGFSLIHGYAKVRQVVEHRLDEVWRSRIVAIFELPGVTE